MLEIQIISACLGVAVGFVLALTGAGGAMIAIPLLVSFFNISIYQATPIALLAVLSAAAVGALQGLFNKKVRYKAALLMAISGFVLAPFGVKLAEKLPNQVLSIALISTLLLICVRSWQHANRQNIDDGQLNSLPACMLNPVTAKLFWTASCTKQLIATGGISGLLSGLLGLGGGFLIVPSLNKISNFNHATVVATTLTTVCLISLSSISSHIQSSTFNWSLAIPFATSTTLTMLIGTKVIAEKIPKHLCNQGFSILCLIAAIYLALSLLS